MKNDLTVLPWRHGQFFRVNTYLEAVGVMMALREGIAVDSLRRPIISAPVQQRNFQGIGLTARPRPSAVPTV